MALGGPNIYPGAQAWPFTPVPYSYYYDPSPVVTRLTSEQQEAYRLAQERMRKEQKKRRRRAAEADARARELLLSMLTPEQKASFEKDQEFTVVGSKGTFYRIGCLSTAGNVTVLTGDEKGLQLCAYPTGVPKHDIWLAQKLALESDEDAFLEKAVQYWRPYRTPFFRELFIQ